MFPVTGYLVNEAMAAYSRAQLGGQTPHARMRAALETVSQKIGDRIVKAEDVDRAIDALRGAYGHEVHRDVVWVILTSMFGGPVNEEEPEMAADHSDIGERIADHNRRLSKPPVVTGGGAPPSGVVESRGGQLVDIATLRGVNPEITLLERVANVEARLVQLLDLFPTIDRTFETTFDTIRLHGQALDETNATTAKLEAAILLIASRSLYEQDQHRVNTILRPDQPAA